MCVDQQDSMALLTIKLRGRPLYKPHLTAAQANMFVKYTSNTASSVQVIHRGINFTSHAIYIHNPPCHMGQDSLAI